MTTPDLLDTLCKLLPSQLDLLIAKLNAPTHHFSGPSAPLATRAIDLLHWADQQHRRPDVERLCAELFAPTASPGPVPIVASPAGSGAPPPWWADHVQTPEATRVFTALSDPRFNFRTVVGLAKASRLSEREVREVLERHAKLVRRTQNAKGEELYALAPSPEEAR